MEMPNVIHPKRIKIDGFIYEVVSYGPLTDERAVALAKLSHRLNRPKKRRPGTVYQVVSSAD